MRWLPALALGLCCVALPVYAQRGGGGAHGGGFGGHGSASGFRGGAGFAGRSAPSVHGGFGASAHPGFAASHYGNAGLRRPAYGSTGFSGAGRGYAAARPSASRPAFYNRERGGGPGGRGREYPYRGRGNGYGYGYGYPGFGYPAFVSLGLWDPFLDFADYDGFDGGASYYGGADGDAEQPATDAYAAPMYPQSPLSNDAAPAYPPDQGADRGLDQGGGDMPQSGDNGPLVYAPSMYRGGSNAARLRPVRQETLVTIYFRDGRPPEQIRNYALTRTSLLVTGQSMREIPLTDLDLPTTERVNRAAGVDFQIP